MFSWRELINSQLHYTCYKIPYLNFCSLKDTLPPVMICIALDSALLLCAVEEWDNKLISHCTCNNLIGQVSPAKHLWLYDWETWNSLSLLSLSFCCILSSRRVPLTPLSFVPPGGWNGWRCEPSRAENEVGAGREGGGGSCSSRELWCSFSFASVIRPFWLLIAADNYHHHYCYLHQRVRAVTATLCRSFINPATAIWLILEFLTFNVVLMLLFFARCQSVTGLQQRAVNHWVKGHDEAQQSPRIRHCLPVLSPSRAWATCTCVCACVCACVCLCMHVHTRTPPVA